MAAQDYAAIKDGVVQNIVVFDDPSEETLNAFKEELDVTDFVLIPDDRESDAVQPQWWHAHFIGSTWDGVKFTSPSPGEGWVFRASDHVWLSPKPEKPYPSHVWDETKWSWLPPVDFPDDGEVYVWDEPTVSWIILTRP